MAEDNVDNILNRDSIGRSIDELTECVRDNFDSLEVVIMIWVNDDEIHHRAYGTLSEVLGLIEKAKYIMLRENIGETIK